MAGTLSGSKEGFNQRWAWDGAQAIRTMLELGFESSLRPSEAGARENRKESQSGWWAGVKAMPEASCGVSTWQFKSEEQKEVLTFKLGGGLGIELTLRLAFLFLQICID